MTSVSDASESVGDVLPDRILLPPGALVVLIGPAGCGKTTFAERNFMPSQIVSTDHLRLLVSDNSASQRATRDAFELMHLIIDRRLKRGLTTVADATNVDRDRRAQLVEIASRHGRPVVGFVFNIGLETCIERNAARGPAVPELALWGQSKKMNYSLDSLASEGFDDVHVLSSPRAVDSVTIATEASAAD